MLRALVVCALLAATPAAAQSEEGTDVPDIPPVEARIALAHGLVEDLLAQYALAGQAPDPEIAPLPPGALPRWTLPILDDAAHALGALVSLRPEAADPHAVARAQAAIGAVHDSLAWDSRAAEAALADLADALGTLADDLHQQAEASDADAAVNDAPDADADAAVNDAGAE
ncbi:hypothetical protein ACM64Y_19195 [Novispirillum sp. DQ9]|uniref:hypothetical protein n=1 Tax=Novispirillum sp. DQ9 TaxID=3398612 RepID=UPI003C7DEFF0